MKKFASLLLAGVVGSVAIAREVPVLQKELRGMDAEAAMKGSDRVLINSGQTVPCFIHFRESAAPPVLGAAAMLASSFGGQDYELRLAGTVKDKLGFTHWRYQEYYRGIPVSGGEYLLHEKGGRVQSANGHWIKDIKANTVSSVSSQAAIAAALKEIGAQRYKWQIPGEEEHLKRLKKDPSATYYPRPALVITPVNGDHKTGNLRLAWKFDVYAQSPMSRQYVYVDAESGKVIRKDNRICHLDVPSTAVTRYSGNQAITSDSTGAGQFRLRELARGNGIETYDMNKGTNYNNAVDFQNGSSNWNLANANMDEVALDAHWGAEKTYDYYKTIHSRNSYDGNDAVISSYVHYDVGYDNAFWNGQEMTYGDGSNQPGGFTPLTSIDICGHEISHGVDEYTANLDYAYESGALNESFSDIFGTCIEFYSKPNTANFLIGEEVCVTQGTSLRDMGNPGVYGDPDTYQGANWKTGPGDNGGVHSNSGVQNFWFYLVCNGGTGTNDNNNAYNVTGIGIQKAEAIAYRSLSVYLTNTSQYIDARTYSIQAAQDLFGACSQEATTVAEAWYAVGVGGHFNPVVVCDFTSPNTTACSVPFTAFFTNLSQNTTSYLWDFGDGTTSNATNPSHTYTAPGTYNVKLVSSGSCGNDSTLKSAYITISLPANPVAPDITHCGPAAVILNAGGNGNFNWYSVPQGGSILYTGPNYLTPFLNATTSYYVESEVTSPPVHVGPVDNNIGSGGNHFNANTDRTLIFDVIQPCTLKSVWVYAQGAGNRTINLWDSQGTIINTTTVNIPDLGSRVNLNFPLTPGTGYEIGGQAMDLYRNDGGVAFPYTYPGYVTITTSSAGSDRYYYLYDWEIVTPSCFSERVMVTANIINCGVGIEAVDAGNGISLYPNPARNSCRLSFTNGTTADVNVKIYAVTGELVFSDEQAGFLGNYSKEIDFSNCAEGMYFVHISNAQGSFVKKITKN